MRCLLSPARLRPAKWRRIRPPSLCVQTQGNQNEIIITAQKRTQRLIDVPQSVSVISGKSLDKQHAERLSDYLTASQARISLKARRAIRASSFAASTPAASEPRSPHISTRRRSVRQPALLTARSSRRTSIPSTRASGSAEGPSRNPVRCELARRSRQISLPLRRIHARLAAPSNLAVKTFRTVTSAGGRRRRQRASFQGGGIPRERVLPP